MIGLKTPASVSTTTAGNCPDFMQYHFILLPQNLTGKCSRLITTCSSVVRNISQCFFGSFPFCCHRNMMSGSNTPPCCPPLGCDYLQSQNNYSVSIWKLSWRLVKLWSCVITDLTGNLPTFCQIYSFLSQHKLMEMSWHDVKSTH